MRTLLDAKPKCCGVSFFSTCTKLILCSVPIYIFLVLYFLLPYIRCLTKLRQHFPISFDVLPTADRLIFADRLRFIIMYPENGLFILLATLPYFFHYVFPHAFLLLAILSKRDHSAIKFGTILGASSIVAIIFQMFFPTAPPWVNDMELNETIVAGLECHGMNGTFQPGLDMRTTYCGRFAYFRETPVLFVLSRFFSMNKAIFGAFPSLHVDWQLCSLFCGGWGNDKKWVGHLHLIWLCWAIIYTNNHYVVDIIGAVLLVSFINLVYNYTLAVVLYRRKVDNSPLKGSTNRAF